MPLKKSSGNMYPWVTHTKSYLGGECPHRCSYCYVQALRKRFKTDRYAGPLRLVPAELNEKMGSGRTIFIEHMSDLFAEAIPADWIKAVLDHCSRFHNRYVFQTKNPARMAHWFGQMYPDTIVGTTIESNWHYPAIMRDSPEPRRRYSALTEFPRGFRCFVTIEPILDFDLDRMVRWLNHIRPDWVNIGADCKGTNLPEPPPEKVAALIDALQASGIRIERKTNLTRILPVNQHN